MKFSLSSLNLFLIQFNLVFYYHVTSFKDVNVKEGVAEFLHKCGKQNSTLPLNETVSKVSLCVENGFAQISGRSFRSTEDIASSCRVVSSVLHCLNPLKDDMLKCSSEEQVAILDVLEDLCDNSGSKLIEFEGAMFCIAMRRDNYRSCFDRADGTQYLENPQNTLGNVCKASSLLTKCTKETLSICLDKNHRINFEKYLSELQNSNAAGYRCLNQEQAGPNAANFVRAGMRSLVLMAVFWFCMKVQILVK